MTKEPNLIMQERCWLVGRSSFATRLVHFMETIYGKLLTSVRFVDSFPPPEVILWCLVSSFGVDVEMGAIGGFWLVTTFLWGVLSWPFEDTIETCLAPEGVVLCREPGAACRQEKCEVQVKICKQFFQKMSNILILLSVKYHKFKIS